MIRQNWFDINGDETLALDWPLNENSLVWEIGGFEGRWAQQIWDKFQCNIRIFEPQIWAQEKLIKRFSDIEKIKVQVYGLWSYDTALPLGDYFTDGASLLKLGDTLAPFEDIRLQLGQRLSEKSVDLALMNIEGGEYIVLPHMFEYGLMSSFQYFWCQFHPGLINDGDKMYENICDGMEKTHEMIWDCYPTAVAWRRK